MQDASKAVWIISWVSVAFFASLSSMYSSSRCSCWFEPEIIKLCESSDKMYSNNILNFQESATILNACTKKVRKLIECTRIYKIRNNTHLKNVLKSVLIHWMAIYCETQNRANAVLLILIRTSLSQNVSIPNSEAGHQAIGSIKTIYQQTPPIYWHRSSSSSLSSNHTDITAFSASLSRHLHEWCLILRTSRQYVQTTQQHCDSVRPRTFFLQFLYS